MQTKGMISRRSALVRWDYYLTVQDGSVIRRDSSAKLIDESACLCLDAALFCRKQRGEEKKKSNVSRTEAAEAAATQRELGGKSASVNKMQVFLPPTVSLFGSAVPECTTLQSHFRL